MNDRLTHILAFVFFLIVALAILSFSSCSHATGQPSVAADDMAFMKQQQRELEAFKQQLSGSNITLPDAQQGRVAQLQNEIAAAQAEENSATKTTPRAVYFVSLGIPQEGLKLMLQDARHFGIPATIRGLLDNDFRKTAATMFEMSKKDKQAGVQIDPTLFEQYGITAVPALVVTCAGKFDVIYGSLPVRQGLEDIARRGDCATTAAELLKTAEARP